MLGMIKKEICLIKGNLKTFIAIILIYLGFMFMNDSNFSFMIPFMIAMIGISTFNYDDFYNWHTYLTTFPNGKINAVKGKYISIFSLTILASLLALLISIIIGNIQGNLNLEEATSFLFGTSFALIILMSILFPLLFKFGAEKGKIMIIAVSFLMAGLVTLFTKYIKIDISTNFINFLDKYGIFIFGFISLIFIYVSYTISKKIYLKKEY